MNENDMPRFAARLNAFKIGSEAYWPGRNSITTADILARAATAGARCHSAARSGRSAASARAAPRTRTPTG